jgi:hypothetical protein
LMALAASAGAVTPQNVVRQTAHVSVDPVHLEDSSSMGGTNRFGARC